MAAKKTEKTTAAATVAETAPAQNDALRLRILDRRKQVDDAYWELAQDLQSVWKDDLYLAWGHADFATYASVELEYAPRSAQYLVTIADYFGKLPNEVQDWVRSLGWSKAKELVGKVTAENWSEIRDKVQGLSVIKTIEFFKNGGKSNNSEGGEGTGTSKTSETQRKGFALFPGQLANVDAALALAKQQAKTDKDGHALDLICTAFLAAGGGDTLPILERLEKMSGLRFVAYDPNADAVVYGADLIESMSAAED